MVFGIQEWDQCERARHYTHHLSNWPRDQNCAGGFSKWDTAPDGIHVLHRWSRRNESFRVQRQTVALNNNLEEEWAGNKVQLFRLSTTAVRSSICSVPLQKPSTAERNRAITSSALYSCDSRITESNLSSPNCSPCGFSHS